MTQQTSSTSSSRRRNLTKSIVFLLGLVVLLGAVQFAVFARHDRDELWTDYQSLPPGSVDAVFLGTSLVHANINPVILWEKAGIRAYDLSGSEQSLLTTLPYLREALRTQKPRIVAVDLHMFSTKNQPPLSENQKRSNLTMMPLGLPKLSAIGAATPAPEWTRYLTPLEQFHSRWSELSREDFDPRKWKRNCDDMYLGYRKIDKVEPQQPSDERREFDARLYAQNYQLLSSIIETAQEADSQVLLLIGPSSRAQLHDNWMTRLKPDIARDYPSVRFLETQLSTAAAGLDYDTDYYDQWHLNSGGAEKYSSWLGLQLASELQSPRESSDRLDATWRSELARYRESLRN